MKFLPACLALLVISAPALAHEGAHLHPHGSEAALTALALGGLALLGGGLVLARAAIKGRQRQ